MGLVCESGTASRAGVSKSLVDFDGESDILLISVPGVGGDAKSLYELSVIRGIFQGNRRIFAPVGRKKMIVENINDLSRMF